MSQPIIDSHVHFWQPALLQYGWLAELPAINRPFLPEDLRRETADLPLQSLIFVQADCAPQEGWREVQWVAELAQHEPRIQAIVAFAPLEQGAAARQQLEQLTTVPLVKGVRRLIQGEAVGFARQPSFVAGVQALADYGFSFDICIKQQQLGDVLSLVEQCPDVAFVLDHLGKPDARTPSFEPWARQITALAQFPQVQCKLSGLVTEADHEQWTRQGIRPFIEQVIAAFGVDRVMYGSDWPVARLATDYKNWVETLRWATADLHPDDLHKLFYQNAKQFYRL